MVPVRSVKDGDILYRSIFSIENCPLDFKQWSTCHDVEKRSYPAISYRGLYDLKSSSNFYFAFLFQYIEYGLEGKILDTDFFP